MNDCQVKIKVTLFFEEVWFDSLKGWFDTLKFDVWPRIFSQDLNKEKIELEQMNSELLRDRERLEYKLEVLDGNMWYLVFNNLLYM